MIPYIFENMLPMPARHGDMVSCAVLHPYTLRTMMHITAAHADMVSCGAVISYTGTQTSCSCHKRQGSDRKESWCSSTAHTYVRSVGVTSAMAATTNHGIAEGKKRRGAIYKGCGELCRHLNHSPQASMPN